MSKNVNEILNNLSPERRKKVAARTSELRAEYLTLKDLRKARNLTQERVAELLNIRQDSVSRLEKRADLLTSTLQSYVKAMGGDLKFVVEFPNRPPVILKGLADLPEDE